jgi:hypothetical protein
MKTILLKKINNHQIKSKYLKIKNNKSKKKFQNKLKMNLFK